MTPRFAHIIWILLCFLKFSVAWRDCISFNKFATCTNLHQVMSLPQGIDTLVITGGSAKTIPAFSFSHLPNLVELNIQHMNIGIINKNAFSDLPKLDLFSLSNSNISVIETSAFRGLHGLSSFSISQSNIGTIQFRAFCNIDNIIDIKMKTSKISFIDVSAFYNLSSVGSFQFYENVVTVVKDRAFTEWNNVMNVTINSNSFGRLECITDSFKLTTSFTFFRNYLECECHLAWILTSSLLKDKLLSNACNITGTQKSLGMSLVSENDLRCPSYPSSAQMGCPNRSETTSASFITEVKAVTSGTSEHARGQLTTHSAGSVSHDQTGAPWTVTHFTQTSFMTPLSSSHVTEIDMNASSDLPMSFYSSSGQSSTCSFLATTTLGLLIVTTAITVS